MTLEKREALLFKYGSGTGTNISTLRSSREKLSGGGKPSGPLAYWSFWDKVAGIVRSGGKTRRAAKMDILNIDHPNIIEFIESKMKEEQKARILIENGISEKEAFESVNYQNTNISVRVTDAFMQAYEDDRDWQTIPVHSHEIADQMPKYSARDLVRRIAEATYFCGDPGMQYDDEINRWHTCPNSAPINASNPCSEFMFIDNSSCNLASLNLMRFLREDGSFDAKSFKQAVRTTAIAQDLEIDNSSYPRKEIAENTYKFRPLGMGYANLGSLIMFLGLPYDSEEARANASAITALLTGTVYKTSIKMAKKLGPFKEYEKNKEPMLNVMKMHYSAVNNIDRRKISKGLEEVLDAAHEIWDEVLTEGPKYGFRNAQATVLAPTGTIAFMMDCDTTGIEPSVGLVQNKLLSDGGILKLVNRTVEPALRRLGYNEEQTHLILEHVLENETIEGAPGLREEHLPVFDCANKPKIGRRTIHYRGHLKMMAAVQPFLSGAISKTVNLPKETSVEEIEQIYVDAWRMKLKSVALYRDDSKVSQPLNFSDQKHPKPIRKKLPTTRRSITHKFDIVGHEGYATVGLYEDGTPGELFINMSKEGSTVGGLMDTIGTLTSMALQYGVPLKSLTQKFKNQKFEPSGLVWEGHPDIKEATSITDYIFNWIGKEFLDKKSSDLDKNSGEEPKKTLEKKVNNSQENTRDIEQIPKSELGGFCPICGKQMFKKGHCIEQCSCGFVDPRGCGG